MDYLYFLVTLILLPVLTGLIANFISDKLNDKE